MVAGDDVALAAALAPDWVAYLEPGPGLAHRLVEWWGLEASAIARLQVDSTRPAGIMANRRVRIPAHIAKRWRHGWRRGDRPVLADAEFVDGRWVIHPGPLPELPAIWVSVGGE